MKLIKLQDKFILVNDEKSPLKIGMKMYSSNDKVIYTIVNDYPISMEDKIIISENPDLSLLSEADCKTIGWVKETILVPINIQDLLIGYQYLIEFDDGEDNHVLRFLYWKEDYYKIKRAWKQTQSLNDKMFSLEDIIQAINLSREKLPYNFDGKSTDYKHSYNDIIQSLQQTSWDVDVEKLASLESVEDFDDYAYNGFIKGFKTAQSLNDKMFSLDDMRKAFEFGLDFENGGSKPKIGMSIWEEFIESLQQTEWDVEVEMEGCSDCHLDEGYLSSPNCCRDLIPKITNNSIKVIKIL